MNPLNYGSLEACKRLVDAGIVLHESEASWHKSEINYGGWILALTGSLPLIHVTEVYPAPSMPEVWRELPEQDHSVRYGAYLELSKTVGIDTGELTYAAYIRDGVASCDYSNPNPTDALIYLLIWYLKQREVNMDNNLCTENPENIIELYHDLKIRYDTLIGDHAASLRFVDDLKKEISELEIELSDTKEYEKEAIKRAEQAEIKLAIIEKKYSVNFLTGEIFDGTTYEDVLIFKKE
jgi:hypothetical protein